MLIVISCLLLHGKSDEKKESKKKGPKNWNKLKLDDLEKEW